MEAVKLESKTAAAPPVEEDEPIDEDDPYWQVRERVERLLVCPTLLHIALT